MVICKGVTKRGFQRLIISSSFGSKEDFTCGFDLTRKEIEKLIQAAQEMEVNLAREVFEEIHKDEPKAGPTT